MFGGGQPGQLIQQSFRPGSDPAQTVFFGPAGLGFCVVHPPDPNKTLGRGLPFWERYTNRFNLKAVKCMTRTWAKEAKTNYSNGIPGRTRPNGTNTERARTN